MGESLEGVSARRTMAYAAGIDASDACYLDDLRPGGVVAPPAFCVAIEWPIVNGALFQQQIGISVEESWAGIHVQQESHFHRLIRPGDQLRTIGTITQIRPTSAGALVVNRLDTTDARTGAPVVTSWFTRIFLKLEVAGEAQTLEEPPVAREGKGLTVPAQARVTLPISKTRAHVYTECAGIWNPIHTERVVARGNALPDIVLHGTCTWAMAGQELIRRFAGGDPGGLCRLAGRFHGMVIPGEDVHLEYAHDAAFPRILQFAVYNARRELAIASGMAQFA